MDYYEYFFYIYNLFINELTELQFIANDTLNKYGGF